MELKRVCTDGFRKKSVLLIVPYGIETKNVLKNNSGRIIF